MTETVNNAKFDHIGKKVMGLLIDTKFQFMPKRAKREEIDEQ